MAEQLQGEVLASCTNTESNQPLLSIPKCSTWVHENSTLLLLEVSLMVHSHLRGSNSFSVLTFYLRSMMFLCNECKEMPSMLGYHTGKWGPEIHTTVILHREPAEPAGYKWNCICSVKILQFCLISRLFSMGTKKKRLINRLQSCTFHVNMSIQN